VFVATHTANAGYTSTVDWQQLHNFEGNHAGQGCGLTISSSLQHPDSSSSNSSSKSSARQLQPHLVTARGRH